MNKGLIARITLCLVTTIVALAIRRLDRGSHLHEPPRLFSAGHTFSWPLKDRFEVSSANIEHGKQQIALMLADRPLMADGLTKGSPLRAWCVRQFAGAGCGRRVIWTNREDEDRLRSMACERVDDAPTVSLSAPPFEAVAEGSQTEWLWSRIVLQLIRLSNESRYSRIVELACDGVISRSDYVGQSMALECDALRESTLIRDHMWHSEAPPVSRNEPCWSTSNVNDFQSWWTSRAGIAADLRSEYESTYSSEIVTYLRSAHLPVRGGGGVAARLEVSWPQVEPYSIAEADVRYGAGQLRKLIHDRPAMSRSVDDQSPVYQWCVRQFAGASTGWRVEWRASPPRSAEADHVVGSQYHPGYIEVSKLRQLGQPGIPASCSELWARTVYELNNTANDSDFERLDRLAGSGKVDIDTYTRELAKLEYRACVKTAIVYEHLWLPSHPVRFPYCNEWFMLVPDSFEEWLFPYKDHSKYPWSDYEKRYKQLLPTVKHGTAK